jgi:NAD(P)-dependent dehydrogenase (short-subunit alcohol dehydrogenase family)
MTTKKNILFSGGTDGLGKFAIGELCKKDFQIYVLARNEEKFNNCVLEWKSNGIDVSTIHFVQCDLLDLASVKKSMEYIKGLKLEWYALVNNAGTWEFERKESKQGIEATFQVNVLAPFLLMSEMQNLLSTEEGRIINTASALHQGVIQWSDIEFKNNYSSFKAYRQSKLCIILLTRLLASEATENSCIVSQHPGVVNTSLVRGGNWFAKLFFKIFGVSTQKGAENILYLLTEKKEMLQAGAYYKRKKPSKTDTKISYDLNEAKKLKTLCESLI